MHRVSFIALGLVLSIPLSITGDAFAQVPTTPVQGFNGVDPFDHSVKPTQKKPPNADQGDYILLTDPWDQYFRTKPKILIIKDLPSGISGLLNEQQSRVKSVLNMNLGKQGGSDFTALEERLAELKSVIPEEESARGKVPHRKNSRTYISYSGTIYRYHSYTTFKEKQKSSSPQLASSAEATIRNATLDLEDLSQRINALDSLDKRWSRKTSQMNNSGTSGIIKRANLAYLKSLNDFKKDLIDLRDDLGEAVKERENIESHRVNILADWQEFEKSRLPILQRYFHQNAAKQVSLRDQTLTIYSIPKGYPSHKKILVCEMGERELYFDLSTERSKLHPFVLIPLAPEGDGEQW